MLLEDDDEVLDCTSSLCDFGQVSALYTGSLYPRGTVLPSAQKVTRL